MQNENEEMGEVVNERNILDEIESSLSNMVQSAFMNWNAMDDDDERRAGQYEYFQALVASRKEIRRVLSAVILRK